MPADKDTLIFSLGPQPVAERLARWRARFDPPPRGQRSGDASAALLWTDTGRAYDRKPAGFNQRVVETVTEQLPESVRIMAILKDPVERAVSGYFHHLGMGSLGAEERLLNPDDQRGIVGIGYYAAHLANWMRVHERERLLVLTAPLPGGGEETLRRVARFLEIDAARWASDVRPKIFAGIPRLERENGIWIPVDSPHVDAGALPPGKPVAKIGGETHVQLIHRDELDSLIELYRDDLRDLADLLGPGAIEHWPTWQRVRDGCRRGVSA